MFMTGAYLVAELILGEIYVKDRSKLGKQLLIHHFAAIAVIYMTITIGTGSIFLGQLALMLEYSTIFLNYRTMQYKHEWDTKIGVMT